MQVFRTEVLPDLVSRVPDPLTSGRESRESLQIRKRPNLIGFISWHFTGSSFCGKIHPCKSWRLYWRNPAYFRKTRSLRVGVIQKKFIPLHGTGSKVIKWTNCYWIQSRKPYFILFHFMSFLKHLRRKLLFCPSEWVSVWVSEWVSEWVCEWVCEWVSEWVSVWVSVWVGEWV